MPIKLNTLTSIRDSGAEKDLHYNCVKKRKKKNTVCQCLVIKIKYKSAKRTGSYLTFIPIVSAHPIKIFFHIRFTATFDLRPCQVKNAAYIFNNIIGNTLQSSLTH